VLILLALLMSTQSLRKVSIRSHTLVPVQSEDIVIDEDEARIAALRIADSDNITSITDGEAMLVCMPTVVRRDGIEYVSNAVKSWREKTKDGLAPGLGRLIVFDMNDDHDTGTAHQAAWLARTFNSDASQAAAMTDGWLVLMSGRTDSSFKRFPRKLTHGDSAERVRWRSKEVLDYAFVLQRCAAMATGQYIAVVQDDVLFTGVIAGVVGWLNEHMAAAPSTSTGAWCSASLFDIGNRGRAARHGSGSTRVHELDTSNMVARVFAADRGGKDIGRLARYLRRRFDDSPVDWLADEHCRAQGRKTYVMRPNPIRHRGAVSSFALNQRVGLLTR
jgi:N-Acetylglucosaminyltransferase-IV (GnT-IV) conserved region